MTIYLSGTVYGDGDPYLRALRSMTVYQGAAATLPRNRLRSAARRNLDLLTNSGALMATTVVNSALGFVFWWVAARSFPPAVVGAATAAISAMTLVGTLSMAGLGTLLISELPTRSEQRWQLISTCLLASGAVALVGGLLYVLLARFVITGLRPSVGSLPGIAALLIGIAVTTVTLVLDDGLVGLLAGTLQLVRNAWFAGLKAAALALVAVLPFAPHSVTVMAVWVGAALVSIGAVLPGLRARGGRFARPSVALLRGLLRPAFDHNLLNLALYLPRVTLPLVVTAALDTTAAGAFYAAFMIFSFLTMIPNHLATTLFAVARGDLAALRSKVRMGLLVSFGLGVPGALLVAALARWGLSTFGHTYASRAAPALAILALSYPATVIRPLFVAICRVVDRVRQATVFAVVSGSAELLAAWYGGRRGGLTDVAIGLALVFVLEGLVTAPVVLRVGGRVRRHAGNRPTRGPDAPTATATDVTEGV